MKLTCVESTDTNPYRNIALESLLLDSLEAGEVILYLWQNFRTVVIGRNQNAWKECQTAVLKADGGYVARRLSGGGAVYQDLGNLNFTFLAKKDLYDVEKQMEVILRAVNRLGIAAEISGRNDITADGRKFSGNAFYHSGENYFHHGTIMVEVNTGRLSSYLNVQTEKLKSKGVDSVRSRVQNLAQWRPELTVEELKRALKKAFEEVYACGEPCGEMVFAGDGDSILPKGISAESLTVRTERFASWDWIYGKKLPFSREYEARFDWGCVQAQLTVDAGRVTDAAFYSDTLFPEEFERASDAVVSRLIGCRYGTEEWTRGCSEAAGSEESESEAVGAEESESEAAGAGKPESAAVGAEESESEAACSGMDQRKAEMSADRAEERIYRDIVSLVKDF